MSIEIKGWVRGTVGIAQSSSEESNPNQPAHIENLVESGFGRVRPPADPVCVFGTPGEDAEVGAAWAAVIDGLCRRRTAVPFRTPFKVVRSAFVFCGLDDKKTDAQE